MQVGFKSGQSTVLPPILPTVVESIKTNRPETIGAKIWLVVVAVVAYVLGKDLI